MMNIWGRYTSRTSSPSFSRFLFSFCFAIFSLTLFSRASLLMFNTLFVAANLRVFFDLPIVKSGRGQTNVTTGSGEDGAENATCNPGVGQRIMDQTEGGVLETSRTRPSSRGGEGAAPVEISRFRDRRCERIFSIKFSLLTEVVFQHNKKQCQLPPEAVDEAASAAATEVEDGIPIPRQIRHTQRLIEAKRGGRGGGRGARGGPWPGGRGGGIAKRGGRGGPPARGGGRGARRGGAKGGAKVMIEPHRHPGTPNLHATFFQGFFELTFVRSVCGPRKRRFSSVQKLCPWRIRLQRKTHLRRRPRRHQNRIPSLEPLPFKAGSRYPRRPGRNLYQTWRQGPLFGCGIRDKCEPRSGYCWGEWGGVCR